ncbi:MAG TPA: hypothetical protein VMF62_19165 [Acetobacteraceae bacterium]|jgi:hypothetical protein|nr:hypothetical protein [Acetobacteraceae bacterium]
MPPRLAYGLGAVLLVFGAASARADDQPPLVPTRDVAVTYHVQDPQGASRIVHMYFDAADQRVHIDMSSQPGFLVIDHKSGEVTMVNSATHSYIQVPAPPAMGNLMFRTPDLHLVRQGTQTVAGFPCTVWEMSQSGHSGGDACITTDGVVLSGRPANAPSPDTGIQATAVSYGPQPADLFAAPAGYQRIQPTMPPGGAPGPAQP